MPDRVAQLDDEVWTVERQEPVSEQRGLLSVASAEGITAHSTIIGQFLKKTLSERKTHETVMERINVTNSLLVLIHLPQISEASDPGGFFAVETGAGMYLGRSTAFDRSGEAARLRERIL